MDLGTALSVAQTLFAALQCQELRDVCSLLGYESELENLACTVSTVKECDDLQRERSQNDFAGGGFSMSRTDDKVESLSEVGEVFRSCSSSLKSLKIEKCSKLKSLCGALKHLTALESLEIYGMRNLNLDDKEVGEDEDGKPWQCLHQSLRRLKLCNLPELVSLPTLYCKRLESLPESMRKLTSLKELTIEDCSAELNERCRKPTGEDWPNIQHIPHIKIWED